MEINNNLFSKNIFGKRIPKSFLMFTVLILITALFTNETNAKIQSKIIFKDGKKITGIIVPCEYEDSVKISLGGDFKAVYSKNSISEIISLRKIFTAGIGFGIPYGMFGINTEIEPIPHINLTIGVGTTILAGIAWDIGIVGYILDQDKVIRPRLSLIYGTNAILQLDSQYDIDYESFPGLSVGCGIKLQMGDNHGMTADLFYLLINGAEERQKELENMGYYFQDLGIPVKLSIGYQFSF